MALSSRVGVWFSDPEDTYGTAKARTIALPVMENPVFTPNYEAVMDQGRRDAIPAMDFDNYQGVSITDFELQGWAYPVMIGHFINAIMGSYTRTAPAADNKVGVAGVNITTAGAGYARATTTTTFAAPGGGGTTATGTPVINSAGSLTDIRITNPGSGYSSAPAITITDSGSGPTTAGAATALLAHKHEFTLAAQCDSYTFEYFAGLDGKSRVYPGGRCGELGFSFNAGEGALQYTSTWQGGLPPAPGNKPTVTDKTTDPFLGWEVTCNLANSQYLNLISAEITISRALGPVYTARANQAPKRIDQDRMEVSASLVVDYASDADFLKYLENTREAMQLVFQKRDPGASKTALANKLTISMGNFNWGAEPTSYDIGDASVKLNMNGKGLYDSGDGGPIKFTLENQRSAAYT